MQRAPHLGPYGKGMHWRTYDRLVSEVDRLRDEADAGFAVQMAGHIIRLNEKLGR